MMFSPIFADQLRPLVLERRPRRPGRPPRPRRARAPRTRGTPRSSRRARSRSRPPRSCPSSRRSAASTTPSGVSLPARLLACAMPRSRRSCFAASRSPSASWRARLQSIIGALGHLAQRLTSSAVISVIRPAPPPSRPSPSPRPRLALESSSSAGALLGRGAATSAGGLACAPRPLGAPQGLGWRLLGGCLRLLGVRLRALRQPAPPGPRTLRPCTFCFPASIESAIVLITSSQALIASSLPGMT